MPRLALIALISSFAVPYPAVPISVHHDDACPQEDGACTDIDTGDIYLDGNPDVFVLAHEIGHLYLENLDGFWKGTIAAHVSRGDWRWTDRTAERAADAYAACALRLRVPRMIGHGTERRQRGGWRSHYGYEPTRREHRRVCSAIRRSSPVPADTLESRAGAR